MNNLPANPNWNPKSLNRFRRGIISLLCCLSMVLSACQSVVEEKPFELLTPSPENTKVAILPEITRPTSVPTFTPTPTPKAVTPTPVTLHLPPTPTELLPTSTSTATPSFVFTGQGFLIYTIIIDGEEQIYALQPGGTSHFITSGDLFYGQPLSPDQTKLIVDTNDPSNANRSMEKVFIYDFKNQEKFPLSLLSYPSNVFWSKDSTSLLYITRLEEAPSQLVLYNISSRENQVLVEEASILFTSGWAIDNQLISYVAKVNEQYDLFTINSETLDIHQLSNTPDIETMALWSPNTLQLMVGTILDERSAFESWPWGVKTLYLVDLTDNEWEYLTDQVDYALSVTWSPNSEQTIIISHGLLCVRNLTIDDEICLSVEPYSEYLVDWYTKPVWSSDMKWVAFRAYNGDCRMLYFWELETNQIIPGDLGCNISFVTPLSGIYWSSADFSFDQ